MTDLPFSQLELSEELRKAIQEMGFENTTPIQAEAIPVVRTGVDVIAKSQTGTGKTLAFAIPALEVIDLDEPKPTIQAMIICPTRELAMQAGDEIRKLSRHMPGIHPVEIYGGADMDRQFSLLRRANLVIGTPGRIMDHMNRGTLKLDQLKMIVLDEADEMLKMGFKEDIETILTDTPEDRQTVLFSATMPPSILALTRDFMTEPQLIEINREDVTLDAIDQSFVDVPVGKKVEVLVLLLQLYTPQRAIIFCNTKAMVDELTEALSAAKFTADSLHGDMKQMQRTRVMSAFKRGKTAILIATDIAARGIDVSNVDFVINFDIPIKTEYYVHRIGRTGRAGRSGRSISLCCGKRQIYAMRSIAKQVKSTVREEPIPTPQMIASARAGRNLSEMETALGEQPGEVCVEMLRVLMERGHSPEEIALAALSLHQNTKDVSAVAPVAKESERRREYTGERKGGRPTGYADIVIDIGSASRVAPNHIVGAIAECSGLTGRQVGKIQIYPDQTVVGVPADELEHVLESMVGCKICGKPTRSTALADPYKARRTTRPFRSGGTIYDKKKNGFPRKKRN